MKIVLERAGKRFQKHWIFRGVDHAFLPGSTCALLGANGSGKSTLLRAVAGIQSLSEGRVIFTNAEAKELGPLEVYPQISFSAPGMDIVEELTLREFLEFHFTFKKPLSGLGITDIIGLTGLTKDQDKCLSEYSSGMKQRVKLVQAICSDTPVLLLDEPCTNLDDAGVAQYMDWIERMGKDRMIIVASNDPREYGFCSQYIQVENYK
jgi:ABC-type multidrug transport system ATPase subunit